jgi:hypothetical protein
MLMMKPAAFGSKITEPEVPTDSDTVTIRYSTAKAAFAIGGIFAMLTLIAVLILVNGDAGGTGVVLALLVFAVGAFLLVYVIRKVRRDGGRAIAMGTDGFEYRLLSGKSRFYVPWSEVNGVRYKTDSDGAGWFVLDLRVPLSKFRVEGKGRWHENKRTSLLLPGTALLKGGQELGRLLHAHLPDVGVDRDPA